MIGYVFNVAMIANVHHVSWISVHNARGCKGIAVRDPLTGSCFMIEPVSNVSSLEGRSTL